MVSASETKQSRFLGDRHACVPKRRAFVGYRRQTLRRTGMHLFGARDDVVARGFSRTVPLFTGTDSVLNK